MMSTSGKILSVFTAVFFIFSAGIGYAAEQYNSGGNQENKYNPYAGTDAFGQQQQQQEHKARNRPDQVGIYITPKVGYGALMATDVKNTYTLGGLSITEHGGDGSVSAFGGGIAVGYDSWPQQEHKIVGFRTELEYFARVGSKYSWEYDWGGVIEKGDLKVNVHTLFVNSYLDFHTGTPFVPYISAGAGAAFVQAKLKEKLQVGGVDVISASGTDSTTNLAGNIGLGTAIEFNENLALDINSRYVLLGKGETSAESNGIGVKYEGNLSTVELLMGLRVSF
jgi:opacity protein-like surface antigen